MMKIKEEFITPDIALEYLSKNKNNRPLRSKVIISLANAITRGEWMLSPEGISFDYDGNLLDGQHRLSAIIKAGIGVNMMVLRGFEPQVFKVLNTGLNRTSGDVLGLNGAKNANNISTAIKKVHALSKNAVWGIVQKNEGGLTNHQVLNTYNENPEYYQGLYRFANKWAKKIKLISLTEIMGYTAYLELMKLRSRTETEGFFEGLAYRKMLHQEALMNILLENTIRKDKSISPSHKQALIIKSWNYYISGRNVKNLRYNAEKEQPPTFL